MKLFERTAITWDFGPNFHNTGARLIPTKLEGVKLLRVMATLYHRGQASMTFRFECPDNSYPLRDWFVYDLQPKLDLKDFGYNTSRNRFAAVFGIELQNGRRFTTAAMLLFLKVLDEVRLDLGLAAGEQTFDLPSPRISREDWVITSGKEQSFGDHRWEQFTRALGRGPRQY